MQFMYESVQVQLVWYDGFMIGEVRHSGDKIYIRIFQSTTVPSTQQTNCTEFTHAILFSCEPVRGYAIV